MSKRYQVLALTRYHTLGASSRIRFYSYKDLLSQSGFDVQFEYLLPNEYVRSLYQGKRTPLIKLLYYYLKRFFYLLIFARKFDLIWVEKELFPGAPTWVEKIMFSMLPPYVSDYDDSIHLNYVGKGFGRDKKIEKIMKGSACVLAGSPYLQEIAELSNADNVQRLPSPVHLRKFTKKENDLLTVGWVGSPATEVYLLDKINLFKELSSHKNIQFIFVGAQDNAWKALPNVKLVSWSEKTQDEWLEKFDIGIMPLRDTLWEKGKCSYKLLLYMSASLPVIASPVGMNKEVVVDGENGYLAESDSQWVKALEHFQSLNAEQKLRIGQNSLRKVKESYTYEKNVKILEDTFKKVIEASS